MSTSDYEQAREWAEATIAKDTWPLGLRAHLRALLSRIDALEGELVGKMEGLGELAWGVDLPRMVVKYQASPDSPEWDNREIPSDMAKQYFEALYQKWQQTDLGHILPKLRARVTEQEREIERLKAECEDCGGGGVISVLEGYDDRTGAEIMSEPTTTCPGCDGTGLSYTGALRARLRKAEEAMERPSSMKHDEGWVAVPKVWLDGLDAALSEITSGGE